MSSRQAGQLAEPGGAAAVLVPEHREEGLVEGEIISAAIAGVDEIGDEVVIKHGAIPSLGMGAMTMAYKAPRGGVPKDVKPGTNVRFEFVVTPQGDMQLTSIVPGGGGAK